MNFMSFFNAIAMVVVLCFLQGCASASPYKYHGQYYMVGDSNCRKFNQKSSNTINCYDSDGNAMGYRAAMTNQDMQMYNANQAQADRDSNERQRSNDRQADKNLDAFCSRKPTGTYGCN